MTVEPASTRANRINSDSLDWSYIGISVTVGHSMSARRARGRSTVIHRLPDPMAADGQRYASPDASICEARARACVSIYSRIFVTLRSRTVMSKTQSSLNDLFVALIFPVATPTTRTRSPCATNSGGSGYVVSTSSDAFLKHSRQFRAPAVRAGQRPVLAGNDPLNIFGNQRQQILLIVRRPWLRRNPSQSEHSLRRSSNLSVFLTSDCVRSRRSEFRWPRSRRRRTTPPHSRSSNCLKPETARPTQFPRDDPSFPAGSGIRTSASPPR